MADFDVTSIPILPSISSPRHALELSHEYSIGGESEIRSVRTDGQVVPTENLQGSMISRPRRAICNCPKAPTINMSGNFWWLSYSASLFPRQGCDSEDCIQRRLSWRLRVALIRFGFPRAFTASLEYVTGSHSSSIRPALTTQQIVRNISPVLLELWKCRTGFSSSKESRDALRSLFKTNTHSQRHVDAEGHLYLWVSSHATSQYLTGTFA